MTLTGKLFRDAVISGANNIANNRAAVDELNVFPVPDGDTGTNMSMTIGNALPELKAAGDGISAGDGEIVTVALSQVGNVGGQPYWSWYGFNSRVEWCACFVSWCANECGYIENGIIPKFAGCIQGSEWFKERGQWQDGSFTPEAGHIIFFDWEGDGLTDHVGIVERVENGTVYTVEGNSGDACRQNSYSIGSSVIYGYGIPAY